MTELWAIFNKDGEINTISATSASEMDAWAHFIIAFRPSTAEEQIKQQEKMGYSARKVEVREVEE